MKVALLLIAKHSGEMCCCTFLSKSATTKSLFHHNFFTIKLEKTTILSDRKMCKLVLSTQLS